MNNTILSMKGIRKTFSGVAVFDEVELNLNEVSWFIRFKWCWQHFN